MSSSSREREAILLLENEQFHSFKYVILYEFMVGYPGSERHHFGYLKTPRGSRVYFSKPSPGEYGEFLAWLKYLNAEVEIDDIFIRPSSHEKWFAFGYFPGGDSTKRFYPADYPFFDGLSIFFQSSLRQDEARHLYVMTHTMVSTEAENNAAFEGFKDYDYSTYLKLDMEHYQPIDNPEDDFINEICHIFFHHEDARFAMGFKDVTDRLRKISIDSVVRDKQTLMDYISQGSDKNRIDLADPLCIDSPEICKWLGYLGNDLCDAEIDAGVLLLNRVIGYYMDAKGLQVIIKHTETSNNTLQPVIKIWSSISVSQLMRCLFFYSRRDPNTPIEIAEADQQSRPAKRRKRNDSTVSETDDMDESEPSSTKRRIFYWFDVWTKHCQHMLVTNCNFEPYPINNPPRVSMMHTQKITDYQNRMALNRFLGYSRDYTHCRNASLSDHGKKCVANFHRLIDSKFCGGNKIYSDYIHNWIAHILQRPDQKTMVMVIIRSQMGMGKGFISKVMQKWWGRHFYMLTGQSVAQKFNSFVHNKKFVWVDEMGACAGDIGILNSMISESTIAIEKKGVDQSNETNLVEMMGGTNNRVNFPIGNDSRRLMVVEAPTMDGSELLKWKTEMSHIYKAMLEDPNHGDLGVWALMYNYIHRDIKGFRPMLDLPRTEAIYKCIEYSLHPFHAWWKYCIENKMLDKNMNKDLALEQFSYNWPSLYNLCRTNEDFAKEYQGRKRKLVLSEFIQEMERIVCVNIDRGDHTRFFFRPWAEQIMKWNKVMPDVPIVCVDNSHLATPPNVQIIIKRIEEFSPIPGLSVFADSEKDYVISQLVKTLEEHVPQKKVVLNGTVILRKTANYPNKDIVEFI